MSIDFFVAALGWIVLPPLVVFSVLATAAMIYAARHVYQEEVDKARWKRERNLRAKAAEAAHDAAMDAAQAELDRKPKKKFNKREH